MALKLRKNKSPLPPEPCALTDCMALISGAWAPNVIWCLRMEPRRFNELRVDIPPSVEYELTAFGQELILALDAIVQVGHKLKLKASD